MRLYRELMTIPVGASLSNGVNIGHERLVGIRVVEDSDSADIYFQELVDGNLGDPASEVWSDIQLTTSEFAPYTPVPLSVVTAGVTDGADVHFPRDKAAYVGRVIRLQNRSGASPGTPANITGTPATFRLITDPHA